MPDLKVKHTKGFVAGAMAGVATTSPVSYILGSRFAIPTKTLEWVIANGAVGLALVSLFVVAGFAAWLLLQLLRSEAARRSDLAAREDRDRDDERKRREEQVALVREQTELVKSWQTGKVGTTELLLRLEPLLSRLEVLVQHMADGQ